MRSVGFFCPGSPLVANRRTIGLQSKRAGNACRRSIESLELRGAMRDPTRAGGREIELLVTDGLPIELNGAFALVLRKHRCSGGSAFLLRGRNRAAAEQDCHSGDDENQFRIHASSPLTKLYLPHSGVMEVCHRPCVCSSASTPGALRMTPRYFSTRTLWV